MKTNLISSGQGQQGQATQIKLFINNNDIVNCTLMIKYCFTTYPLKKHKLTSNIGQSQ